jgi:outer membrane protein TolC
MLAPQVLAGCAIVPRPLTDAERTAEATNDLVEMFAGQAPIRHPLTLEEAFARALSYNLDQRVKMMEEAVAQNDLDLSRFDLLPKVIANAGYTSRSNVDASSSRSVITGLQSLEPSTSTDQNRRTADLSLSWNLLDFGVSYYNARQMSDRRLVATEQRRKAIQSLFQDVRRAFWRTASAQRLRAEVNTSIRAAERALESSRKLESEALRSPVDALRYQRALLDLLRELETVQRQLDVSRMELAALINLPPAQNYTVAAPRDLQVTRLRMPIRKMEEIALLRNPDLRELSYQARISADESRKALLKLLPGITLNYGPNYDSNSFLVNHNWVSFAARLSGNLINLLALPDQLQRGRNAEDLAATRRQAMSIAVLAKVHIAYQQYLSAAHEYQRADETARVDRRLYEQISNRVSTDSQSELEQVSARASAVNSDLRRYQSYSEAQAALGRLYATLGLDPVPEELESRDIRELSRAIRRMGSDWQPNPTFSATVVTTAK